jgi:hypothetical protein
MKIISIHQPHYHPWLGLLDKIASSHEHIVLDDVQYRKRNFQNRALYSTPSGSKLLTVPVLAKGHQRQNLHIQETLLAPQNLKRQYSTLLHRYGKTEGWHSISDSLAAIYEFPYEKLVDLNLALLSFTMKVFNIHTPIVRSSDLKSEGQKNQKLIQLCQQRQATHYLSGNGAKKYMDETLFARHGIQVRYQEFTHPEYQQYETAGFQSGCFALDWYCLDPQQAISFFQQRMANTVYLDDRCA